MAAGLLERKGRVIYGDEYIDYFICPRTTDAPKVLIKVHPDLRIVAHAPLSATEQEIGSAVKKRARWVHRQIRYFEDQRKGILPRRYVSGESHFYLGRRHMLKVIDGGDGLMGTKLLRGVLEVKTKNRHSNDVKKHLLDWYKTRAKDIFVSRLKELLSKTPWVKDVPHIRLFSMKTQWGSCSPKGHLTLNPHLVKAPRECIDYVILHELCHIAEHNHGPNFYRLLNQTMPNWKTTKERLDGMAYYYLNDC